MISIGKAPLLFPIFFALLPTLASAQKIEIGGGIGAFDYRGDLAQFWRVENAGVSGEVFFRYNLTATTVLRGNLQYGRLRADAANLNNAYLSAQADSLALRFSAPVIELAAMIEYNFFDFRHEKYRRWSPYVTAGVAAFYFQPGPSRERVTPSSFQPALPFGVGVKYALTRNWNLGAEFITRKTFTDLLDGTRDLDPLTGLQRGNPYNRDWYAFLGLTVSYTFYSVPCPYFDN
ncbi:MAG: DUF6089 family protein [Catalinimonas sp.]